MDVEKSSLCNCVVNFLLEENYLLSAFELLHELLEDGCDDQAIRLKDFFSNPSQFPPDQIARFSALRVADPQSLLEEKEALEEKLAISEYDLRLAQEDLLRLKTELQKQAGFSIDKPNGSDSSLSENKGSVHNHKNHDGTFIDLGPLKDTERRDLNCAVKEYLLLAGYRLTAMTFYEEVTDQNIDVWQNSPACVPDALRHFYYEYLSSTADAAEEKITILRERDALTKANDKLNIEKQSLLKHKELADNQIATLTKSLETAQKDIKDQENVVQSLKKAVEQERKQLNDCRAEITSLKMQIEVSRSSQGWISAGGENLQQADVQKYEAEIKSLQMQIENLNMQRSCWRNSVESSDGNDNTQTKEDVEIRQDKTSVFPVDESTSGAQDNNHYENQSSEVNMDSSNNIDNQLSLFSSNTDDNNTDNYTSSTPAEKDVFSYNNDVGLPQIFGQNTSQESPKTETASQNMGLETIQILSDALPKIVPYVLINHREELLPLIMCAIERHPNSNTRDSLTHTLFNLIKRPDEQQRRIIMDACVTLAKNVGEMRTETELLPQCWEQINHMYEERRLLVAQSCGELAEFVRPEIRDSLILSILQQLVEDSATVVREAAAHNLALLLPLFPNMDKYFKVEDLMFQLVCDPSGVVVETSLRELVPPVINWGNKLDHVLRVSLSHILSSAQRCPPLSGVEGSVDSHLRVLGERERWNIDVLLRMLVGLLPVMHQRAIDTCPFPSSGPENVEFIFSTSLLEIYAREQVDWPTFDWIHVDCYPGLIELACLLPQKEDNLRNRITKFLMAVSKLFGDQYTTHIMLPVFLVAVGDTADLKMFPLSSEPRIRGLRPNTALAKRLAIMCVLPLLFAGILGRRSEQLVEYLRKILVQSTVGGGSWSTYQTAELIDSVRFLCTFEEHHGIIFNILWEMVVSSDVDLKIRAANLLKVLVPYVDEKVASTQVLPALVTLGSDQNLNVKYASIDAFGAVAQNFKNNMIVDKIRVQMDAFLEDGSHEATIAVIRSLVVAVPNTTERLRDYLLSKIFHLTSVSTHGIDVLRRRERANAFCESIRALDATDLPATSVREYLLPAINNLLKDPDALDPAHKEALEIIMRERSGGTFETISKVMGAHLGIPSSMSSLFGEGGLLGKKEGADHPPEPITPAPLPTTPQALADDTRFRRIMRGNFGDMLRGKGKSQEENSQGQ